VVEPHSATELLVGDDLTERGRSDCFPIVGIGASAGGLEPMQQLFGHLPIDTGMAFVVIQHLDPHRPSQLTKILAANTAMPVIELADGMRVEPNRVYVI
jgi:two-component system CheB/CheR fusion protein